MKLMLENHKYVMKSTSMEVSKITHGDIKITGEIKRLKNRNLEKNST